MKSDQSGVRLAQSSCATVCHTPVPLPKTTRSYGVQKWTTVSDFIEMWDEKDPIIVGLTPQQALGCCVDGLCIASTYDGLRAKRD